MFADLDERQREQVWGFTLPLNAPGAPPPLGHRRGAGPSDRAAGGPDAGAHRSRAERRAARRHPGLSAAVRGPDGAAAAFRRERLRVDRLRDRTGGARRLLHQRHAGGLPDRPPAGRAAARLRAARRTDPGAGRQPELLPHPPAARRRLRRSPPRAPGQPHRAARATDGGPGLGLGRPRHPGAAGRLGLELPAADRRGARLCRIAAGLRRAGRSRVGLVGRRARGAAGPAGGGSAHDAGPGRPPRPRAVAGRAPARLRRGDLPQHAGPHLPAPPDEPGRGTASGTADRTGMRPPRR